MLVQAQVLNLLEGLRTSLGLSYLFIAHDLALVKQVSDRVAVMYLGRLCEVGPADEVYAHPRHPYTVELLDAVPRIEQDQRPDAATQPAAARRRRGAVAGAPAVRLPVPDPVPARPASLRGGDPAARARSRGRGGAPGRVPFPDRAAEPSRSAGRAETSTTASTSK